MTLKNSGHNDNLRISLFSLAISGDLFSHSRFLSRRYSSLLIFGGLFSLSISSNLFVTSNEVTVIVCPLNFIILDLSFHVELFWINSVPLFKDQAAQVVLPDLQVGDLGQEDRLVSVVRLPLASTSSVAAAYYKSVVALSLVAVQALLDHHLFKMV
ncbi:hypothetical protein J5N97_013139 [Dioscorea zingiberensis]|uniref:Uncharacterized protein n=1 Tax=Dioscorea zingiberensis TaxID=325984 RepID=A0A9D5CSS6_9LILI|nr:hypothetical protein J5N97_013139 [Dioscorea zingiberensis]